MTMIWRAVAQPLARITRVRELVAAGTAGVAIPYAQRGDEIGALARSIAVFQDAMRQAGLVPPDPVRWPVRPCENDGDR